LALAENAALRVDLFGGERVSLERRLAEHGGRPGQERHVAEAERRIGNFPFRRDGGFGHYGADNRYRARRGGGADREAELIQETPSVYFLIHGCILPLGPKSKTFLSFRLTISAYS